MSATQMVSRYATITKTTSDDQDRDELEWALSQSSRPFVSKLSDYAGTSVGVRPAAVPRIWGRFSVFYLIYAACSLALTGLGFYCHVTGRSMIPALLAGLGYLLAGPIYAWIIQREIDQGHGGVVPSSTTAMLKGLSIASVSAGQKGIRVRAGVGSTPPICLEVEWSSVGTCDLRENGVRVAKNAWAAATHAIVPIGAKSTALLSIPAAAFPPVPSEDWRQFQQVLRTHGKL